MPSKKQRRIVLVPESQAESRVAEIYREIKAALGLPHVNLLFQAYGAYPSFLELQWRAIQPMVRTAEFFNAAERLRAEAYTRAHNYFSVPDFCAEVKEKQLTPGARQELAEIVELFHYNNPLLLLIVAALTRAFDEGPSPQRQSSGAAGHPVFEHKPVSVPEDTEIERVKKIYEDMKRTLDLPFINSDYRAFGRFPDFLEAYWNAMKPALSSPFYAEHKRRLKESAIALAAELPVTPQLSIDQMQEAGFTHEEISTIVRITDQFLELIAGLVLSVCFAKIGLEGGTRLARSSSFGKEGPKPQAVQPKEEGANGPPERVA